MYTAEHVDYTHTVTRMNLLNGLIKRRIELISGWEMWQDNNRFDNTVILHDISRAVAVRLTFDNVEIFDVGIKEEPPYLSGSVNRKYCLSWEIALKLNELDVVNEWSGFRSQNATKGHAFGLWVCNVNWSIPVLLMLAFGEKWYWSCWLTRFLVSELKLDLLGTWVTERGRITHP